MESVSKLFPLEEASFRVMSKRIRDAAGRVRAAVLLREWETSS